MASAISDSTAIMPIFLIKEFLLYWSASTAFL
jgi:hypothetical protein